MIVNFKINTQVVKNSWEDKNDIKEMKERLQPLSDFTIPVYHHGTDLFIWCFKGYEDYTQQPELFDYGYGLTFNSITKYLEDTYGKVNPSKYLVEAYVLSFDTEKYWKSGFFVDLEGNDTGDDFYELDNYKELEKKADIENSWIAFSVFKL